MEPADQQSFRVQFTKPKPINPFHWHIIDHTTVPQNIPRYRGVPELQKMPWGGWVQRLRGCELIVPNPWEVAEAAKQAAKKHAEEQAAAAIRRFFPEAVSPCAGTRPQLTEQATSSNIVRPVAATRATAPCTITPTQGFLQALPTGTIPTRGVDIWLLSRCN
jgi:hypothetical protein